MDTVFVPLRYCGVCVADTAAAASTRAVPTRSERKRIATFGERQARKL
jgi:hypothetical protein